MNGAEAGLSPQDIERHLEKILASTVFKRAERQSRLLSYIIEHSLRGNTGALREASIGVEVYSRPSDFDPREDTIVRVEASRLRTRLLEYYESDGKTDPVRITIPKGGYVPVYSRKEPAPEAGMEPARSWRRARYAAAAGILLAVSVGAYSYYRSSRAREGPPQRKQSVASFNRAMELHMRYTPASVSEAVALHEEITRQDPTWSRGFSGLAHTYISGIDAGVFSREQVSKKILETTRTALALEPDAVDAYTALIRYYRDVQLNWPATTETCRTAMSKKDDLRILANCSGFHSLMGNHEICNALFREAIRNHPKRSLSWRMACEQHYRANRYEESLEACDKQLELDPESISARIVRASIFSLEGSLEKASEALKSRLPVDGIDRQDWIAANGYVSGRAGDRREAQRMIARLDQRAKTHRRVSPAYYAYVHLGLGDEAKALEHLEAAARDRDPVAVEFLANPLASSLRGNERFQRAAAHLGIEKLSRR